MSETALVSSAGRARVTVLEHVMGMPVAVEVCDEDVAEGAIDDVFDWLRYVDATFSTYDPASEISRLNRGELALADASIAVRSVLEQCESLRQITDGFFDISAPPGAGVDPSGFVKGWSVLGGARLLAGAGARNFCIDAGGDIVTRGEAPQGGPWQIGVAHPSRRGAVAAVVALSGEAVATSGAYERGGHIVDPHTGAVASGLLSVTVVGPELPRADAFATAAFAMGRGAVDWCRTRASYEFMLITDEQEVLTTAGFERYRVRDGAGASD